MKIIPKYASGSSIDAFLSIYQADEAPRQQVIQESSERSSSKSKDKDDDGQLTIKDIMKMFTDNAQDGLPNDMRVVSTNIYNVLKNAYTLRETDPAKLTLAYLSQYYRMQQLGTNYALFNKAYETAKENKSLSDIAMLDGGIVLVYDKNSQIRKVSTEDYKKIQNKGGYIVPLTVGNVLWLRQNAPEFAFNNDILRVADYSIGIEKVQDIIKNSLYELGKTETKSNVAVSSDIIKGSKELLAMVGNGPEGYYKITQSSSGSNENQIIAALKYVYGMLPPNAKQRLALVTENGTQEEVYKFIYDTITSKIDYKVENDFSQLKDSTSDENSSSSGSSSSNKSMKHDENVAVKFINGYGSQEQIKLQLGDEYVTDVNATIMPLATKEDKPIGTGKPLSSVMESSYGNILDLRHASIAGVPVSSIYFKHMILDDNKIYSIDYPIIIDQNTGKISPDFSKDTRDKKRVADKELMDMGINPYNRNHIKKYYKNINQIYIKHKLNPPYNDDGTVSNRYARFGVMSVTVDGRELEDANKSLLREVTDDYLVKSYITAITESDKNYTPDNSWWGAESLYNTSIWIPIKANYNMATALVSTDSSKTRDYDERDQARASQIPLTTEQP